MSKLYKQTTRDAYFVASAALRYCRNKGVIDDMLTAPAMREKTPEEKQAIKDAIDRLAEGLMKRSR